ncbi:signal peptidase I [Arthrobacter glacialis]|uniref:Signal peptidase I n=1 Tax=Arthrobacter glacialis TaxID=1664 RepID=A0A2S4A0C7_ARTGL|nr:signal peptidase I [Arthrobacter glacialis]POH60657.1 signal peptidase I [Arthrobacter glacialis]POH74918.1 signal peptidase I [Arthrobacter glacialis]
MSVISPVTSDVSSLNSEPAGKVRPRGILHSIGSWSAYVVLLLAAVSALIMIVAPMATGSQTYTVLTNSMAPKYAPGTFLVVKPTEFSSLRVGDVITFQIESGKPGVISHRITSVGSTQTGERVFTTKGDNNSLEDAATVQEVQIKGKLLYAVPYVGFAAHAVGEQRGKLLPIIAVGFISLGALSMVRGAVEKKRGKHEKDND